MTQHKGRVALVTGGARGIGAEISRAMARSGYHVAIGYSAKAEVAQSLSTALAGEGHSVSIHQGNVGLPEDCRRVAEEVVSTFSRVDVLVNNAGITIDKTVRKMSIDDWHAVLRVNLSGGFYMIKPVLEQMLERGTGRIINIASIIGETGGFGQANYAASKAGLVAFTKSLALEVAQKGVTVNCIAPGAIETEMTAAMPKGVLDRIVERIPMRRLGAGKDVARAVMFLADDAASYITGQVLAVNGGLDM